MSNIEYDKSFYENFLHVLNSIGIDTSVTKYTNHNIMIRCPFAKISGHSKSIDTKPSFGIKIDEHGFRYNCLTCDRKGISLLELLEELFSEGVIEGSEKEALDYQNRIKIQYPNFYSSINVSEERSVDLIGTKNFPKIFYDYHKSRGVSIGAIKKLKLRYNEKRNSVIFPIYERYTNKFVGYVEHIIGKKYSNEVDREYFLYLEWLIKGNKGIVVEGMYDAIRVYQHLHILKLLNEFSVVAVFGAKIAGHQLEKLNRYFDMLFLMGDNDLAGKKLNKAIIKNLKPIKPFIYEISYDTQDPAKLSLKSFEFALKNRIKLVK